MKLSPLYEAPHTHIYIWGVGGGKLSLTFFHILSSSELHYSSCWKKELKIISIGLVLTMVNSSCKQQYHSRRTYNVAWIKLALGLEERSTPTHACLHVASTPRQNLDLGKPGISRTYWWPKLYDLWRPIRNCGARSARVLCCPGGLSGTWKLWVEVYCARDTMHYLDWG